MVRFTEDRYHKALNCSRAFQEVLIYGEIPGEAILITLPWKVIKRIFQNTHMGSLNVASDLEQPFSRYCDKLRGTYHGMSTQSVQAYAVNQAMEVLGCALYPKSRSIEDLEKSTNYVYHFSRSLFAWPYRHPSYKIQPLPSVNSPVDHSFPNLRINLLAAIEAHRYYRRIALEVHLKRTEAEIASYRQTNGPGFQLLGLENADQGGSVDINEYVDRIC